MKKILCLLLVLLLTASGFTVLASEDVTLLPENAPYVSGVTVKDGATGFAKGDYIGFSDVDLTGINSVKITGKFNLGVGNGETIRIKIDDPKTGEEIGFVVISETKEEYFGYIGGASGVHDVYFVGTYWSGYDSDFSIKSFTLSKAPYEDNAFDNQVDDSYVKDFYEDTWVSVDDFGRRVAEYPEAGPVKEGEREVGMLYWNWFSGNGTIKATVISDITTKFPNAMTLGGASAWNGAGTTVWDEPVYGYYNSYDYWVYRRHAELFAAAGVDVIFPDCSNGGTSHIEPLMIMARAFRDAKKEGIKVPKISSFTADWTASDGFFRFFASTYNTCFQLEDFSDIWYMRDGKPFLFGMDEEVANGIKNAAKGDPALSNLAEEMVDFFSYRRNATGHIYPERWTWIETFPQMARGVKTDDGRPELVAVGVSKNSGYVGIGECASDPYAMGRAYSAPFGEDYREEAIREAYYYREEASLALDYDPHFIMFDGWNELKSDLYRNYGGYDIAFPDTFDSDNSRDMEPVRGLLKDDCYNMLVDVIRKYKGVRPAPVASGEITIDINGDASVWANVAPEFLNYKGTDRTGTDAYISDRTEELKVYDTVIANRVISSKAARDAENFYFMAKADKAITMGDGALQLLINTDRNAATGENGYDYILGRKVGAVEAIVKGENGFTYNEVGKYEYTVKDDVIQIKMPRALIGETGKVEMELKWVSGAFSDILDLYANLSSAPIGRFNYLFIEEAQKALTKDERAMMKNSTLIQAGNAKMIANGGIVDVYEADTRVATFEMFGTVYVPLKTLEEIIGWGKSKTEYDYLSNILYIYNYELDLATREYKENNWYYTIVGTNEAYKNGKAANMTNPVVTANGMLYVPLSVFTDLIGRNVTALGNGCYLVGDAGAKEANALLSYIN
ncbi:MAG: hypothetical protein IJD97_09420 [Clostridia bacterium]|nr:hypothetical protein [Clostridia bacterium]